MKTNAYILDWTMNDYEELKEELSVAGFASEQEQDSEHVRVEVPFEKVDEFAKLVQAHLNAPQNYVDIQYPEEKTTVVIFKDKSVHITSDDQNEEVRKWAMSIGLPKAQADWPTAF